MTWNYLFIVLNILTVLARIKPGWNEDQTWILHMQFYMFWEERQKSIQKYADFFIFFCAPNSLPMCKRDKSNQFTCLPFIDSINLWTEKL